MEEAFTFFDGIRLTELKYRDGIKYCCTLQSGTSSNTVKALFVRFTRLAGSFSYVKWDGKRSSFALADGKWVETEVIPKGFLVARNMRDQQEAKENVDAKDKP